MNNRAVSLLFMETIKDFTNLIKIMNNERHKMDNILTDKQFFALGSMINHDKIELKNLSKELYVSTSSLCILLNKLVDQGYVYREEDSKDRRNTFYGITEDGRKILNSEIEKFLSIISLKVDNLDEDAKSRLSSSATVMNPILKEFL